MRRSTTRFLVFAVLALGLGVGAYFLNANSLYAGISTDGKAVQTDACSAKAKAHTTSAAGSACEYKAQHAAQTASACTEAKAQKASATAADYGVKTSATSCSEVHESVRASAAVCPVTGAKATQTAAADCDMKSSADCDMKAAGTDCCAQEKAIKADGKTETKAALASLDAESSK